MTDSVPQVTGRTVYLSLPAAGRYVGLARTTVAAVAARVDFTVDRIDDLRLAVDEAAALLIAGAPPGSDLACDVTTLPDDTGLLVHLSASRTPAAGAVPGAGTFAWTVLTALVDEVRVRQDPDSASLDLLATRGGAR